ncbi:protein of unknown function (plasmid) [Cupriavidus taiwanensis]|uniref:Uncharacterized protein n=1 Tax=Cupriavidus taiwanensis TaxID=164546 RepID=A0A9Q7XQ06_9BURK|nr:protein of unknown function [Cupriavidus taiwanensis]
MRKDSLSTRRPMQSCTLNLSAPRPAPAGAAPRARVALDQAVDAATREAVVPCPTRP